MDFYMSLRSAHCAMPAHVQLQLQSRMHASQPTMHIYRLLIDWIHVYDPCMSLIDLLRFFSRFLIFDCERVSLCARKPLCACAFALVVESAWCLESSSMCVGASPPHVSGVTCGMRFHRWSTRGSPRPRASGCSFICILRYDCSHLVLCCCV